MKRYINYDMLYDGVGGSGYRKIINTSRVGPRTFVNSDNYIKNTNCLIEEMRNIYNISEDDSLKIVKRKLGISIFQRKFWGDDYNKDTILIEKGMERYGISDEDIHSIDIVKSKIRDKKLEELIT